MRLCELMGVEGAEKTPGGTACIIRWSETRAGGRVGSQPGSVAGFSACTTVSLSSQQSTSSLAHRPISILT
jgi:hypothetical protein